MRRDGIERLELSESYVQQRLGLASVTVTLHATPAKEVRIMDVPIDWAKQCQRWYKDGISKDIILKYKNRPISFLMLTGLFFESK